MKFYEAPDLKKIEFDTESILAGDSIVDPNGSDGNGKPNSDSIYEVGKIPLFE